jgi:hypothetical protein
MSQSTSGPGPELFNTRVKMLQEQQAVLVKKVKAMVGQVVFSGNV